MFFVLDTIKTIESITLVLNRFFMWMAFESCKHVNTISGSLKALSRSYVMPFRD